MNNLVTHTIEPFCPPDARILILGTIPSPKSREFGFYYGHPQNRFWRVLSDILNQPRPETNEEKKDFLPVTAALKILFPMILQRYWAGER